jgi:DNA (cytosine-5)-methyltransferase 1
LSAYYNENDAYAAEWLRQLIVGGHIANGEVDERSIVDVQPDDLRGHAQCHFFAGIGGWSYALELAGWSDDRPVWTGSCPCQPFSAAGKNKGGADSRHLWPHWFRLICECRPAVIFGEQVEAAIGWGWLDAVCADLEGEGYATGAAVLPACGVGAPHIRQRVWFVADAEREFAGWNARAGAEAQGGIGVWPVGDDLGSSGSDGELADGAPDWSDLVWLPCTDGKARPTQSGVHPLAHGIPGRVGRLRAYGNAIVAPLAAEFIGAFMEARDDD